MSNRFLAIMILCVIIFAVNHRLSAQESNTLKFMKGMSQSDLFNPALHNDSSKVVIGFPGLSGVGFDFSSGFSIDDVVHKGTGSLADSLVVDLDRFYNALGKTNSVQQHLSVPLFYLGIRGKRSFLSFGISEKEIAQFSFDRNLVGLIKDGNAPYMGKNLDLGDLDVDAVQYTEFALGYSADFLKRKLTIGVKAKALYGRMAMQTERLNLRIETAADGSSLNLNSDINVNISAPVTLEFDQEGVFTGINTEDIEPTDYIWQKENSGLAFDLGAVLKLNSRITLSASILDLGKVSFKNNLHNLSYRSDYKWEGIDFSNSIDESAANYVDPSDLVDEELKKLEKSFTPKRSDFSSNSFQVSLPTRVYLGGTFKLTNKIDVGVLDRMISYDDISYNTVVLSANTMLGNFLSLSGSYSINSSSENSIGAGMSFRLGFMQLYVVADNVQAAVDPTMTQHVNAQFGMNFLFGRKHKAKFTEPAVIE